jgi:hypothetical protein
MDVKVHNGLSAQWPLQCAMDVKLRNGRYIAQWTLKCAMALVRNGRYSAQKHQKNKHSLSIKIYVCVCVFVCVVKRHVNYAYCQNKHKHIPATLPNHRPTQPPPHTPYRQEVQNP